MSVAAGTASGGGFAVSLLGVGVGLEGAGVLGVAVAPVATVGPGLSVPVGEMRLAVAVGEAPGAAMEVEVGGTVGTAVTGGWDPQAASVKPNIRAITTDHNPTNVRLPPQLKA